MFRPRCRRSPVSVEEGVEVVAPIQPVERAIVDGLQSVLDHQPGPFGKAGQQVEHLFAHAIGPRADDQPGNLGMRKGFFKAALSRSIGP